MPAEATRDTLLGGTVTLWQPKRGYRVNVDAVLLAHFAAAGARAGRVVDLGAGSGAVGLVLHALGAAQRLALVERETALCALARRNLREAGIAGEVFACDLESDGLPSSLRGSAELVVCNPPFFEPGSGRPRGERLSRSARSGRLEPFVAAARLALHGKRARAAFVYPARSLEALFAAARAEQLVPKRLRLVHATAEQPARIALVELRAARPGGLVVEPPLHEWRAARVPTEELARISAGKTADRG